MTVELSPLTDQFLEKQKSTRLVENDIGKRLTTPNNNNIISLQMGSLSNLRHKYNFPPAIFEIIAGIKPLSKGDVYCKIVRHPESLKIINKRLYAVGQFALDLEEALREAA